MRNFLTLWIVSVILCSCSSSKGLVKSLSKYNFSLNYPHNSDIVECERQIKIAIGAVRIDSLDMLTKVSKTKRSVYPFIFYNSVTEKFWINLGQNSLEQPFQGFFINSFFDESDRTGCYTIVDDPKEADYVIDFIIKDYKTESVYQMENQVFFLIWYYITNFQESGFSALTDMEVQVRFIGRSGRSEKTYTLKKEMPLYKGNYDSIDDLRYLFMANMVKSLSITTKECIETIIKDINLIVRYEPEE
jgi:hypothetical protein